MELPTYFKDFISDIRPGDTDLKEFREAHTNLRKWLQEDVELSKIIIATFLQGSYKRGTAVKSKPGKKGDVDVVVVTNIDKDSVDPDTAIRKFIPFVEKYYPGRYEIQGRSIGITLDHVALDLVITAAPSEAQQSVFKSASFSENLTLEEDDEFIQKVVREQPQWKAEQLFIPDRDAEEWVPTDPLTQIKETQDKNARCNGHFLDVVKALKWWRQGFSVPKYPKGYPVEHLIWLCCPNGITSVAQGVTETLEAIVRTYPTKPFLKDHGVPDHDVFKRITEEDYQLFYNKVKEAATLARKALDETDTETSAKAWNALFGDPFPPYGGGNGGGGDGSSTPGGFTPRTEPSRVQGGGRFG